MERFQFLDQTELDQVEEQWHQLDPEIDTAACDVYSLLSDLEVNPLEKGSAWNFVFIFWNRKAHRAVVWATAGNFQKQ